MTPRASSPAWSRYPAHEIASRFAADWDALNGRCGDLPFLSAYCLGAALDQFGSGRESLFLRHDGPELTAGVVLTPARAFKQGLFQPSQLPLGACLLDRTLAVDQVGRELLSALSPRVLALDFTQLDPWLCPRPADTRRGTTTDYIDTGWIDLVGDFDAYWRARGKNLRENLRKQRRKLSETGMVCRMHVHDDPATAASALRRYGALESSGWKAREGTAVAPDNLQGRFYAAVLRSACERGEGRVYEYTFGEQTVAMELCLLRGDTLIILKTAYDETVDRVFSPASLLRQEQMQHLFAEARIKRVEFYGRFMEWHGRWTSSRRTLYHLTVFRWPIVSRLRRLVASRSVADGGHVHATAEKQEGGGTKAPNEADPGRCSKNPADHGRPKTLAGAF